MWWKLSRQEESQGAHTTTDGQRPANEIRGFEAKRRRLITAGALIWRSLESTGTQLVSLFLRQAEVLAWNRSEQPYGAGLFDGNIGPRTVCISHAVSGQAGNVSFAWI